MAFRDLESFYYKTKSNYTRVLKLIAEFDKEHKEGVLEDKYFNKFKNFISNSNLKKHINFDDKKREISINSDTPPIFYNILYEFLV